MRSLEQIQHDNARAVLDPSIVDKIVQHEVEERLRRMKESLEKALDTNPDLAPVLKSVDAGLKLYG